MKEIPLTQGKVALIDDEDWPLVSQRKWRYHANGYAHSQTSRAERPRRSIYMHRVIMNPPEGMDVDHINGDGLDNRRANLRICTHAENQRNMKRKAGNRAGHKGVSLDKHKKRWRARIFYDGREHIIGYFATKEEAAAAYAAEARIRFGEFAREETRLM